MSRIEVHGREVRRIKMQNVDKIKVTGWFC